MATLTLEKMAGGGMYDQIGGGFHRYSTDARWLVPHFEKMLYDNALLAVAYAEAFQVTARADFARVVRETLDYVLREMTAPGGAFYSATDADSEGEEGKFFVWTETEIRERLGADATRFMRYYGVTAGGNFAEIPGANILNVAHPDESEWAALAAPRAALYAARVETRATAARRQAARGLERAHDLGAGGWRPDPGRAALCRGGGARGRLRARAHARRRSVAAQLQGGRRVSVGVGVRLPRRLRVPGGRAVRSLRGHVRRALAARGAGDHRRDRAPLRRRAARRLVHDQRRARAADRAREAGLRRRRAVGHVGRAAERVARLRVHRRRALAWHRGEGVRQLARCAGEQAGRDHRGAARARRVHRREP